MTCLPKCYTSDDDRKRNKRCLVACFDGIDQAICDRAVALPLSDECLASACDRQRGSYCCYCQGECDRTLEFAAVG